MTISGVAVVLTLLSVIVFVIVAVEIIHILNLDHLPGRIGIRTRYTEPFPRLVQFVRTRAFDQVNDHSKRDSHRRADVFGFDLRVDLALYLLARLSLQRRTRKQTSENINVPRNSVQPSIAVSLCVTRSIIFVFFMISIRRLSMVFSTELFA